MKDKSIFEGVVLFDAEGLTYQAIRKERGWEMAAMEQLRVVEMHHIAAPHEANPKRLLTAWWAAQRRAGTYSAT